MKVALALVVLALAGGGCIGRMVEDRVAARTAEKSAAFVKENGRSPSPDELAALRLDAAKEVALEREHEKAAAVGQAAQGASQLTTGNVVGGGILLIGAALTYLGLARRKPPESAPAPSGGGV